MGVAMSSITFQSKVVLYVAYSLTIEFLPTVHNVSKGFSRHSWVVLVMSLLINGINGTLSSFGESVEFVIDVEIL